MIRLLLAIDKNKSLQQIAAEVDLNPSAFKRALDKLLEQGLIEPVSPTSASLDQRFLQVLRLQLSQAIGPMAEILIEDVISEMALSSSEIPVNQAAELIATLSLEIPDENSRMTFKKAMLEFLNPKRT
jgi:DNA-binding transcriptional regulator YhcF (GntR family)